MYCEPPKRIRPHAYRSADKRDPVYYSKTSPFWQLNECNSLEIAFFENAKRAWNPFPCPRIQYNKRPQKTIRYILCGRIPSNARLRESYRRKNYELLFWRQSLSLDPYHPAHSRNVRKRLLIQRIQRLRMAHSCRPRILHVQKRDAPVHHRKRLRFGRWLRLQLNFPSDRKRRPRKQAPHSVFGKYCTAHAIVRLTDSVCFMQSHV